MLSVQVICVGKLKEKFYLQAVQEYAKRLGGCCKLELIELPEEKLSPGASQGEIEQALRKEGAAILSKVPPRHALVALCIEGESYSSEDLAERILRAKNSGEGLAFVVGSSFGLSGEVKKAAQVRLSMSRMTFPHHLARVMLLEQIYRGFKIAG